MDTSTLSVVFLLVMAASLASYALSHWISVRGVLGMGWAATSIGTILLLTAAAIVVLTFVFRGPLWRPSLGTEQQVRQTTAAASKEASTRPLAASPLSAKSADTSAAAASDSARTFADRRAAEGSPASSDDKRQPLRTATTPSTTERGSQAVSAFKDADPWAATRCVYVFNPDLSEPDRWKIENGCEAPVGVVLNTGRSIVLPAPAQRPVTLAEQTVQAGNVRHKACFLATSKAMTLIGAPSEERSTPAWREQFDSARVNDGCLLRLQSWNN